MSSIFNPLKYFKEKFLQIRDLLLKMFRKPNRNTYKENLLRNFLQNIEAADVMIQRSEIKAISIYDSTSIILKKIGDCKHDIIPVYQDNIDDVKGCVRVKDVYKTLYEMYNNPATRGKKPVVKMGENHLKSIILNVIVVSPFMQLATLLDSMQIDKVGMAVVADEFGGTSGFVIPKSIVDSLAKECNSTELKLKPDGQGKIRIDAKMDLDDFLQILTHYLSTKQPTLKSFEIINHIKNNLEESRTVGGFICIFSGKIPAANSVIQIGEIMFYIVEANPRRINTIEFSLSEEKIKK